MSLKENERLDILAVLRRPVSAQPVTGPVFIFIDGPCDADCLFCSAKKDAPTPAKRLLDILDAPLSGRKVCLIGNDPLLHPEITAIVARCRTLGAVAVEVMTSGTGLCEGNWARKLIQAGVSSFSIPLHSTRASIHDSITLRPGSHARTLKGSLEAAKAGASVFIHTNLIRQNIEDLENLEAFVVNRLGWPFAILPVRPKSSNLPYKDLAVPYERIRHLRLRSLIGFPHCAVAPKSQGLHGRLSESLRAYFAAQAFEKPSLCASCEAFSSCPGTFREHWNAFGKDELRPLSDRGQL